MADPGGHRQCTPPPPPTGSISFIFTYIFAKKCTHQRLAPPPPWEILDPPLINSLLFNIFQKSTNQICSHYEYLSFYCLQRVHFCLRPQRNISHIIGGSTYKILRRTPPPTGPSSFVFTYIFTERYPCWRSMPTQWVHASSLREFLDPPLII